MLTKLLASRRHRDHRCRSQGDASAASRTSTDSATDDHHESEDPLLAVARAASLADVRVADVSVAHTRSRLQSARFFVEFVSPTAKTWGIGASLADVRAFEKRYLSPHRFARCSRDCAVCASLAEEIKDWRRVSKLRTLGQHKLQDKAERVAHFFTALLALLARHAQWAHACPVLDDLLAAAIALAALRFPLDDQAAAALESMKPIDAAGDCAVCLERLDDQAPDETHGPRLAVALPCGHDFHDTCVGQWLGARHDCPVCRAPIDRDLDERS